MGENPPIWSYISRPFPDENYLKSIIVLLYGKQFSGEIKLSDWLLLMKHSDWLLLIVSPGKYFKYFPSQQYNYRSKFVDGRRKLQKFTERRSVRLLKETMPYNKRLVANIGPRSFLYGPRARLVRW